MRSATTGARTDAGSAPHAGDAPADASDRVARPTPAFSHLAACPACGSLNGHSAPSCWNCEANLSSVDLSQLWPAIEVAEAEAAPLADTEHAPLTADDDPTLAAAPPEFDALQDAGWGADDEPTVRAGVVSGFEHPPQPGPDPWATAAARLPNATDPPYPVLTRWIDRQAPDFDHSREVPFEAPRDDAFAPREMQGLPPPMAPDLLGMAPRTDFHDTVLLPPARAPRASPRLLIALGSVVVLIGALGTAAYLYLRPTEGEVEGARSTARESAPVVVAPTAPVAKGEPDTRSAAPKSAPDAALDKPAPAPVPAPAPATAPVATPTPVTPSTESPAKPAAAAPQATVRATGAVQPAPAAPNPAPATRRPPAAATIAECTPTVAALGLCTLPPAATSKE